MEGGEPQTLNGWIEAGIAPTSTGIPVLDRVMSYGDACTAHPHVLLASREGDCDRLVIWTWHRCLLLRLARSCNKHRSKLGPAVQCAHCLN